MGKKCRTDTILHLSCVFLVGYFLFVAHELCDGTQIPFG